MTRRTARVCAGILAVASLAWLWLARSSDRPGPVVRERVHFAEGEAARRAGDLEAALQAYRRSISAEPKDPRPYFGLVEAHHRRGDLDAADAELRALQARDPKNASVRYGLGCLAVKRQDLEAACAEARAALRLDPHLGHAHLLLGSAHYYAGRLPEALAAWGQARKVFRRARDGEYEAWALNRTALVRRELGHFRSALAGFEEALALQVARGDTAAEQLVRGNLGLTRADLGDLAGAMDEFRRGLALAAGAGDRAGARWNLTNLAHVLNQAGEHRRAIDCADSAVTLARLDADAADHSSGLLCRASACLDLGDPLAALAAAREAEALTDSLVDPRERTGALLCIARACLQLGQLERARETFASADGLFREIGAEAGAWEARIGLCETLCQEGDSAAAIALGERTLAAMAQAGYAEGEEGLASLLAVWAGARGDPARALALCDRALELSREGRRNREALALARRSGILLRLDRAPEARADAEAARRIALEIGSPEVLWPCELALGDALRNDDPRRAAAHYDAVMEAIEGLESNLRLEEFRAVRRERQIGLYYRAAELFLEIGRPEEAFLACERARARAFRELVAASPASLEPRVPEELRSRGRALEERLHALQATRRALLLRPDSLPQRQRAVERELSRVRDEWEEARAEMLRLDPSHRAVGPGASRPELPEIWRALGDDEAILEYALALRSSLGFVLRRGEVHAVPLALSGALIAGEIDTLLSPFDAPLSLSTLEFDLDLSSRIRAQVIDPLLPRLDGVRRLYIVPDGPLHRLPFEALVLERSRESGGVLHGEFAGARYLDERFTISYLPAASLLAAAPRPPGDRSGGLLAMGDPGGIAAGGDPRAGRPDEERAGNAAAGPGPARLLHSRAEIVAIAGRFPGASVWTGAEATEDRFRRLAPQFRLVHLAAHGEADEIVPLYSGFSLAADPLGREDGFLRAYEVLSIPLDCDLVTLSACATGRGRAYRGEGLLGLTRCFLHAGARKAVVSLWGVNDRSTADLMERFYSGLAEGRDPAEALREAKAALRGRSFRGPDGRTVSLAHPFFWAPFIVVVADGGR